MRLYQRGSRGTWWVDFTVPGLPRFKRSTGTTDYAAAQEWAAKAHNDQWRQRRLGEAPALTWDDAVLSWLGENQHLRSIEEAKRNMRWLSARLAGKPLPLITADLIRRLASERAAEVINADAIAQAQADGVPPPAPRRISGATCNRYMADLSRILTHAHERGWLSAVPAIPKTSEPKRRVAWLTREQADVLLDELPDHLRAMAGFALATGLRESNIRLLEWSQVDLQRGLAWIHGDQAKAGRDIGVPLNPEALAVLRRQRDMHKRWVFPVPRWEKKRNEDDEPRQVWDSPTGKVSNHAWRKACVRAGVPWLRFHDLRHTWASWHVQNSTPLPVLQELGGWASLTMVQRYAHLGVSHVAAWAGNVSGHGTTAVQPPDDDTNDNGPEGPFTEEKPLGWLMGLEPTTTRITRRSQPASVSRIKDLREGRKRKTG